MFGKQAGVLLAHSTVDDGNLGWRFGEKNVVLENRRRFLERVSVIPKNAVCMECVNNDGIVVVTETDGGRGFAAPADEPVADVLITNVPGLALCLLTADCIPAAFYDPEKRVVALAHLNRHTIRYDLAQKTVGFLREKFHCNPTDLVVHFGPHISPQSYQFPLPLTDPTPPQLKRFIEITDSRATINLAAAHRAQLEASGIPPAHITVSTIDTATSPDYFSHYRSARDRQFPHGRFVTILKII